MAIVQQIVPANNDWFMVSYTEGKQSIYPVAAWALVDSGKVIGLIGPKSSKGYLAGPPPAETEYKHRQELNEGQLHACFTGTTYDPSQHQPS